MEPKDALGKWCRDLVLGTKGICIGIADHLYGCRAYILCNPSLLTDNHQPVRYTVEEQCLEITGDEIVGNLSIAPYDKPMLLGSEVVDKVTKIKGICIARHFPLVGSAQYYLETISKDGTTTPTIISVDEGRLCVIEDSENAIAPEDVQGKRPGGETLAPRNIRCVSL